MSNWRVNEEPPADFLELLYDEDESEDNFSDEEDYENIPRRSPTPEAPAYSPLTSPRGQRTPSPKAPAFQREERSRSRSPITPLHAAMSQSAPSGVVVRIYDEDGTPLESLEPVDENIFLTPDAHVMYVSSEGNLNEVRERDMNERGRSGRRGGRREKRTNK